MRIPSGVHLLVRDRATSRFRLQSGVGSLDSGRSIDNAGLKVRAGPTVRIAALENRP